MKLTNKIYDEIYELSHHSRLVQRIVFTLLNSGAFVRNPIYSHFHHKQMKMLMEKYEAIPQKMIIENTNVCNSDCTFCVHRYMSRKKGFMDPHLFKKIIDDCAKLKVKEVAIYRLGEPLLDPQFSQKISYAKKVGIEIVSTNTNASLLSEDNALSILDSGLDVIYISLDATSKDIYERIRRGLSYDVVERNIKRFIELRNTREQKPTIILSFCVTQENRNQIKDFIRKWQSAVDQIWISDIHDWSGIIEMKSKTFRKRIVPCRLLWTEMTVSWDGTVPLCCVDYDDTIVLGDLTSASIKEVWGEEKMKKYRRMHMEREFNKIPLCRDCTCYFSWWMRK